MAGSSKRSSISSDAASRSSSIAEKRKDIKTKRKWIKGLAIVSSEDDSDSAKLGSTVGTSKIIALRFPYPMLSDDSDDEEDWKFFPNDSLRTEVPTQKKRKHFSSSDEHTSYKHKKRKKTLDNGNKNSSDEQNKEAKRDTVKKSYSKRNSTFSDKENLKYDSPRKHLKSKSSSKINSSPLSTSSNEDIYYKKNRTADKKTDIVSKQTSSTNRTKKTSKTLNHVKAKSSRSSQNKLDHVESSIAIKSNQNAVQEDIRISDAVSTQVCSQGNNRFLDSSSCESEDEQKIPACNKKKSFQIGSGRNIRYRRRIHMISSSSSSSDNDEVVNNQTQHNLVKSRVTQPSSGYNKSNHSISTSNDEDDGNLITNENFNKNNEENIGLPKSTGFDKHPCHNLLKNFNNTEPQQSVKNEKNKTDANKVNKNVSKISNKNEPESSKSKMSNIKSSAWTNIANVPMKSNYKSSKHQLKINDLKKKFVSSNISSIEIHKQIQNKSSINQNNKERTSGLKDLKNKVRSVLPANVEVNSNDVITDCNVNESKSAIVQNSGEVMKPIENKYTVNVNVFCSSPQNSEIEGTEQRDDHLRAVDDQTRASDQTKLDINLSLHDSEGENIISDHYKKTRISHVSQGNINKNKQSNKPIIASPKSLKLKNNKTERKITKQNERDVTNQSKECDVLGNILSEMENNPYKTEKPIKKAMVPITNMLNWSQNPFLFPNNTQTYNPAYNPAISSNTGGQGAVQSYLITPLSQQPNFVAPLNTNYAVSNCATTSASAVWPSKLDYTDRKNLQDKHGENKKELPIDFTENNKSVTMRFYSANSPEYTNTKRAIPTTFEQNGLENRISSEVQQTSNNNSTENKEEAKSFKRLDGTPNKSLEIVQTDETNKIQSESKENAECDKGRLKSKSYEHRGLTKHSVEKPINDKQIGEKTSSNIKNNNDKVNNNLILHSTNTDSENNKGVRIKFGGTVFRLPAISPSENQIPAFNSVVAKTLNKDNKSQSNYVHSNNIDNPALTNSNSPRTDVSDLPSSSHGKDTNVSHSEDSDTTSSDSDDTDSESSSASSEYSSGSMQKGTKGAKNISTNCYTENTHHTISPTEKDDSLKNQTAFESALGNLSNSRDIVTKGTKAFESVMHNNNDNDVIVLSDSSDIESSNINEESFKDEDTTMNSKSEVPPSNISDGINSIDSLNFVGKIRVKSLKDLGVEKETRLPENALPTAPVDLQQVMSDRQLTSHSTSNISETPRNYEAHQIQPEQPTNSINTQQSNLNGQLDLQTESTTNHNKVVLAITHKMLKSNKKVNSIISESKDTQYQQNCSDNSSSTNQLAASTGAEANTSEQQVPGLQNQSKVTAPTQSVSSDKVIVDFYTLFNSLFTEIVQLKIPKLVDDLHLAIIHDRLKEERLKKLDQLISPETIASERRRAEKDFNDVIKIRGQSFVPLFMTIVNRISKGNFKTLIIAFYYVIVQHLERIDPANAQYRFKLKDIIKCMLQKHSSPLKEQVLAVFNCENSTFIANFNQVESWIFENNRILEENKRKSFSNEPEMNIQSSSITPEIVNSSEQIRVDTGSSINLTNALNGTNSHIPAGLRIVSATPITSVIVIAAEQPELETQKSNLSNQNQPKLSGLSSSKSMPSTSSALCPPNSRIGNLDELLFKKNSPEKSKMTR